MAKLLSERSRGWRWRRAGRWTVLALRPLILVLWLGFPETGLAQPATAPLPPPRPDFPASPADGSGARKAESAEPQTGPATEADTACLERLDRLGVRFEKLSPIQEKDCRIGNPVSVSALPNAIETAPASVMECTYAENLARWIANVVVPRASEHLQSTPTKLLIGTGYQCRDQRSGAKLSEHAFGNGVDVMGFEFDRHPPLPIKFQAEGSPEAAFQSAIQKEACSIFTTVLGPGSDDDHGDHLHLDMRMRKGDYRICQ